MYIWLHKTLSLDHQPLFPSWPWGKFSFSGFVWHEMQFEVPQVKSNKPFSTIILPPQSHITILLWYLVYLLIQNKKISFSDNFIFYSPVSWMNEWMNNFVDQMASSLFRKYKDSLTTSKGCQIGNSCFKNCHKNK